MACLFDFFKWRSFGGGARRKSRIICLFVFFFLIANLSYSATFVVLWETQPPGALLDKTSGYLGYFQNTKWQYVESFETLAACKKKALDNLKDKLVSALVETDSLRVHNKTPEQIKKYRVENPHAIDKVITDGILQRDQMGLVPLTENYKWIKEPSSLTVITNNGERINFLSLCVPDTIDPRK